MKKAIVFSVLIILLSFSSLAYIGEPGKDFVPNQLIVKFKASANIQSEEQSKSFLQSLSPEQISKSKRAFPIIKETKRAGLERIYLTDYIPDVNLENIIQAYQKNPNIEYAQPNYYGEVQAIPNDPNYPNILPINQSGLRSLTPERAWDYTVGSPNVIIAHVDLGVANLEFATTHQEFQERFYINIDEIDNDGIDNDINNCIDDYYGCDITKDSGRNLSDISSTSHGTKIAGILAAATNNNFGMAGTCWNCKIMVIRIANCPGGGCSIPVLNLSKGIVYAINNSANIISVSTAYAEGQANLSVLNDTTIYADEKNVILIAAAGNQNNNPLNAAIYPGSYSTVLGVAGLFDNGTKWIVTSTFGSNYGTWIDISAPSYKVVSTLRNGSVGITGGGHSGTSFAAPFVAAQAGLILSAWPGLTKAQVEFIIKNTTDNIDSLNPGFEGQLGTGRINLTRSLEFGCFNGTSNVRLRTCSDAYYCDFVGPSTTTSFFVNLSMCGQCTDTDGGINENITGEVTYYNSSGTQTTDADTCQNQNMLNEYYCQSNISQSTQINCGQGRECNAGTCITSLPKTPPSGSPIYKKQKPVQESPQEVVGVLAILSRFLRFIIPAI